MRNLQSFVILLLLLAASSPWPAAAARPRVDVGTSVIVTDTAGQVVIGVVESVDDEGVRIEDGNGRIVERSWESVRDVTRFTVPSTYAQKAKRRRSGWLADVPLAWVEGGYAAAPAAGFGTAVAVNLQIRETLAVQARHLQIRENFHGHGDPPTYPEERFDETAILISARRAYRFGALSASAGPSWLSGIERGEFLHRGPGDSGWAPYFHDGLRVRTVGAAAALNATWTPSRFFGVGVTALGDLNAARSFWGLSLGFHVGYITRKH